MILPLLLAVVPQGSPVRVLFLGDRGHHQPAARFAELAPVLERRGIQLTYTEDLAALDPARLEAYDALAVFANIDELPVERERALVDFVRGGKGLVALHCASYCFRNSDAYVRMVGGQFQRHGTGVFSTRLVGGDHPILRGHLPFASWDETYVHTLHNPDRTVLEAREDEEGAEPYTWVRDEGAGRVFYTAWGHDQRTWTHPGFQELVERGIRWAARETAFEALPPLPERFTEPARIPNYLAGADDPRMQSPLDPEPSLAFAAAVPGVRIELFASEPLIHSPLALAWDDRGRLFLAESVDYPNERRPAGSGRDRIVVLADTDGDGRADRADTFADDLSLPTSMLWLDGGLIVHQPPQTLFLRDTDGDGRADERRVLLEGWGTGDTHAGPSQLRYGLDNWVWGTVGYSSFQGTVGDRDHRFGQAVYRFRPDGSELEVLCSTSNNTWGLGFSETGEAFVSTANNDQIDYLAIPNRAYEAVQGWHGNGWAFIGDYRRFHPLTDTVRQVDWHGRFTAAAGCAPYTARAFPEKYWNRIALICEPTGHLVHESILEQDGAGFVAHDGLNLVASRDEWCAPIAAEVGPDGAVWVLDWYSYVVQHNPTPRGFDTGAGGAYVTPHRDKERARIWRLVPEGPPSAQVDLDAADGPALVAALENDNMQWRLRAQRRLVARGQDDVVPLLAARVATPRLDAIGQDPGALHALWTLHGLGALGDEAAHRAALGALEHPASGVRANAARALAGDAAATPALVARLDDADALVVREALLALAEAPRDDAVGARVFELLGREDVVADRWLADAATAAAARHDGGFLGAALAAVPAAERTEEVREPENLLPNPSFEEGRDGRPAGWRPRTYSGSGDHAWVPEGRFGSRCLRITSDGGADTSWYADVDVDPRATYRLSGWVRTQGVRGRAMGALFNVHTVGQTVTPGIDGDSDWQRVEVVFDPAGREQLSLNCLFGGWGQAVGTAWFDDVRLERVQDPAELSRLGGVRGSVVATVTRHFASRGSFRALPGVLARLESADPGLTGFVLTGLVQGWPADVVPTLSDEERARIVRLGEALPTEPAADLYTLARSFAMDDLTAEPRARVAAQLGALLHDPELSVERRLGVAGRLLALSPGPGTWQTVAELLSPREDPELCLGLVRALGEGGDPRIAGLLLECLPRLTVDARRAVLGLCLRRDAWASALLDAVEAGTVPRTAMTAQVWQRLQRMGPDVSARAAQVAAQGGTVTSAARGEVFARLEPLAAQEGDARRGHEVFQATCMVCHTFAGEGGEVGPALDGIGTRGKAEVLLEVVDPNRSLESNYQLWVVKTLDGEILTGRIASESRTAFELLDSEGHRTAIDRADVDEMVAQSISVMPEGLIDELAAEDVRDLLQYLVEGAGER